MEPLYIVIFLDGRPGHEKQTKGLLKALEWLTPISVEYRKIERTSFRSAVRDWFAYICSSVSIRSRVSDHYKTNITGSDSCIHACNRHIDLIIGAGSRTHIPMLLLKQKSRAKVVTCMTPAFPLARKIDLCFVPHHDRQKREKNVFLTAGPPTTTTFHNKHDRGKGLILVGGVDKKSHKWSSETVMAQIRTILKRESSIKWTVSSSPRTPHEMIILLNDLASQSLNVDFFRSEETPEDWIEKEYEKNFTVWVTADSISMIYEALTAGCVVGILPVEWRKKNSKFQRNEDYLLKNRWVVTYEMWLNRKDVTIKRVVLNEALRCAREIIERWWPNRLQ